MKKFVAAMLAVLCVAGISQATHQTFAIRHQVVVPFVPTVAVAAPIVVAPVYQAPAQVVAPVAVAAPVCAPAQVVAPVQIQAVQAYSAPLAVAAFATAHVHPVAIVNHHVAAVRVVKVVNRHQPVRQVIRRIVH